MTNVGIVSTVNAVDGVHATVTLSGVPGGSITFWAGRTPDSASALSAAFTGANPYQVTLPHAGAWYIWAKDGSSFVDTPGAVWIGLTGRQDLDEIGIKVRDILNSNKALIDAALQQWYDGQTVKQIEYGFPANVVQFPSIVVLRPRVNEPYVGLNHLRQVTVNVTLSCMMFHQDEQTQLPSIVEFVRAVMYILNQPAYESITTPDGRVFNYCQAEEGEAGDVDLEGIGFAAYGNLEWSAMGLRQDTG